MPFTTAAMHYPAWRTWRAIPVTAFVLGVAIVGVQLLPWRTLDFPPFVMTIEEWRSARVTYGDGTTRAGTETFRLEYRRHDDWTLTFVSDNVLALVPGTGTACHAGTYETFDERGTVTVRSTDPEFCNGVGRWIHYGVAQQYHWERKVVGEQVVYTSQGEKVVFDLTTGLPLLYEAGPPGGTVGERTTYRLERWGP